MKQPFIRGRFSFWWSWRDRDWSWPAFHCTGCCWFWFSWGPILEIGFERRVTHPFWRDQDKQKEIDLARAMADIYNRCTRQ